MAVHPFLSVPFNTPQVCTSLTAGRALFIATIKIFRLTGVIKLQITFSYLARVRERQWIPEPAARPGLQVSAQAAKAVFLLCPLWPGLAGVPSSVTISLSARAQATTQSSPYSYHRTTTAPPSQGVLSVKTQVREEYCKCEDTQTHKTSLAR